MKYPNIKTCADQYNVVVKKAMFYDYCPESMRRVGIGAILGTSLGVLTGCALFSGIGHFFTVGLAFICGVFGSLGGLFSQTKSYSYNICGQRRLSDGGEISTKKYLVNSLYDDEDDEISVDMIPNLTQELKTRDQNYFLKIIAKNYPKDGIYDTASILNILQNKVVKNDYANGEAFNYPIDINRNSTVLMKFFDLRRTDENAHEYDQIASIIKSTPNINFNQQDNVGISIIENVLNSENADALEIIKDVEFEYTSYLDTIFNNIKDENFKAKTKSLKINFNAPKKALFEEKSMQKFQEAATCLDSPFCNSREKALEIWDMAQEQFGAESLKEINMILYKYLPEPMRIES